MLLNLSIVSCHSYFQLLSSKFRNELDRTATPVSILSYILHKLCVAVFLPFVKKGGRGTVDYFETFCALAKVPMFPIKEDRF